MPYIAKNRRVDYHHLPPTENAGELNYMITMLCKKHWDRHDHRYETLNSIIGALECAKQEFIRRVVNPYEQGAIERNGDLYE